MSGSGEYTTTPNLGLYKPTYNADAENWGFHLNSNSDTLDAALVGGGSYIATGGTVPRTAADRAADVANVLDFGADPMNAIDSTAAFNTAASQTNASGRYKSVYMPTGSYRINGQIVLHNGQTLFGDGRGLSVLIIDGAFSHTATSVIFIQTVGTDNLDPGPTIRDFGILFVQPQSNPGSTSLRANYKTLTAGGTTATGIQYPWAISMAANAGRTHLRNLRISGAWNGITTNGTSGVYWIDNLELGALNIGISIAEGTQALDFANFSRIEWWNFGLDYYTYGDHQTTCLRVGGQNGFIASSLMVTGGKVMFTAEASNCWATITNFNLDGATLEIAAMQFMQIGNLYAANSSTTPQPAVSITGGISIAITNWWSACQMAQAHLNLNAPSTQVSVVGGEFQCWSTTASSVSVSAGTLRLNNVKLTASTGSAYGQALISQGGTGILQVDNLTTTGNAGSSGNAVQINADNVGNVLGSISLGTGWRVTGALGTNGRYGDVYVNTLDPSSIQTGSYTFSRFTSSGHNSTSYGSSALFGIQDGAANVTAVGANAGFSVTTGSNSVFVGALSGWGANSFSITGADNTFVGALTAFNLTSGAKNTVLGSGAAFSLTTGSNNIVIGAGIDTAAGTSNVINIGGVISATGSNTPATSITTIAGSLGTTRVGTASTAADLIVAGPAGTQKNVYLYRANNIAWGVSSRDATDDYAVLRFDDGGGFKGNSFLISRANGRPSFPEMPASTTYANDGAAATGGVPVGGIYRNGSVLQIRVS